MTHTPSWRLGPRTHKTGHFVLETARGDYDFYWNNSANIPASEHEANARLIASAPELLEALEKAKSAVEWMADASDSDPEDRELLELVNNAIKKARG